MIFTTNAVPILKMQNYKAYNRADMYVPNQRVSAPLHAATLATPFVGHSPVHAVPLIYGKLHTITIGSKGMATPIQGGVQ